MTPDLVPDRDVWTCLCQWPFMLAGRSTYRLLFSFSLERQLTMPEVDEILSKAHYGPVRWEDSWDCLTRTSNVNFWRSSV